MEATTLAKYLIAKSDNVGDWITNKKLQKLLYYTKAWGLVYFANGIIDDQFEAWVHGPVCPSVYVEYKPFGYKPLSIDYQGLSSSEFIRRFCAERSKKPAGLEMMQLVDAVFVRYAIHTSLELERMTHAEEPWIEARAGLLPSETGHGIIRESTMKRFFGAKIEGVEDEHYIYDESIEANTVEKGIQTIRIVEQEGKLEVPKEMFDEIVMYD